MWWLHLRGRQPAFSRRHPCARDARPEYMEAGSRRTARGQRRHQSDVGGVTSDPVRRWRLHHAVVCRLRMRSHPCGLRWRVLRPCRRHAEYSRGHAIPECCRGCDPFTSRNWEKSSRSSFLRRVRSMRSRLSSSNVTPALTRANLRVASRRRFGLSSNCVRGFRSCRMGRSPRLNSRPGGSKINEPEPRLRVTLVFSAAVARSNPLAARALG